MEQILEYGKTMKRDKDSSESSSDERPSKKIHMDSPQLSNGQEQCMDLSLPLMYSYSDRESCCEPLPQFFLPRPRLSSLRVIDGHGFPPEMVPFVNVRISDCSLSYMLTVILHPCPDAWMYNTATPINWFTLRRGLFSFRHDARVQGYPPASTLFIRQ